MSEDKEYTLKITDKQLALIQYWRESCHHYNNFCPLHCVKDGTNYCHLVTENIKAQCEEQKK